MLMKLLLLLRSTSRQRILTFALFWLGTVFFAHAQTITVKGTVTDEANNPLQAASVTVKGGTVGTLTNEKGSYSLNVAADAILQFSYMGYAQQEVHDAGEMSESGFTIRERP